MQKASGDPLSTFGGLIVPFGGDWWRLFTAPFAYVDVGYLFVVAVALAIFAIPLERRLGSLPTGLLRIACGALGMLVAGGVADSRGDIAVIAGGNGMALGAVAAWFTIRRSEAHGAIHNDFDTARSCDRRGGPSRPADLRFPPPTSSPAWLAVP